MHIINEICRAYRFHLGSESPSNDMEVMVDFLRTVLDTNSEIPYVQHYCTHGGNISSQV